MKIRNGFVSNSSSASFLIFGTGLLEKFKDDAEKIINEKGLNLDIINSPYSYYIGISWDEIADEETGREFKTHIEKDIKTLFEELGADTDRIKCFTHSETWYDG